MCRKLRHCSTLSRIKSVLQSSKLEIVELHTNVSRTHWSMGNGLRNAEKTVTYYFCILDFFLLLSGKWRLRYCIYSLQRGGQKKWTFLFQQPIFFKDYHQYIFLCWTCAFTNRKALCGTPNWKAMCLQTWQVQTVDFWCGKVAEKPSIY